MRLFKKLFNYEPTIEEIFQKNSKDLKWSSLKPATFLQIDPDISVQRTLDEIGNRSLALYILNMKSRNSKDSRIDELVKEFGEDIFTSDELEYLHNEFPSEYEDNIYSWSIEASATLFWVICTYETDVLGMFQVDPEIMGKRLLSRIRTKRDWLGFQKSHKIIQKYDLYRRSMWNVRQNLIDGVDKKYIFDPNIIQQKLQALSWVLLDYEWEHPIHVST